MVRVTGRPSRGRCTTIAVAIHSIHAERKTQETGRGGRGGHGEHRDAEGYSKRHAELGLHKQLDKVGGLFVNEFPLQV